MSYQVIARKWRPQTFDDVVGQDHVVRTLKNAIARGRIAHAYLFVGPRGTGKTSLARIFAKALNCTGGPKADFDPNDPLCQSIADGTFLDVIEIDGASNNGVEQVRELRDTARYAPAQGKFKVYIIDEVHMLSTAAFNALLKTLEEPPAHVKFVFATTDPQKVLPTIMSRCQRFDLKPIPPELIVERLQKIAAAEKIKVTAAALACIARLADGGMRDAQSIFDQMISFCGSEIAEADVLDVYGLVAEEKIAGLAGALAAGDHKKIIEIADDCDANGRDLVRLLVDVQAAVRVALLDSIAKGGASDMLGATEPVRQAHGPEQVEGLTTEQLTRMLDALREGEGGVKLGLAEKINFEVALLKAVEASRARAIDSLIKELSALAGEATLAQAGDASEKKGLMAALEARMAGALQTPQVTSDKYQGPKELAEEPVADDVAAPTEPVAANGIVDRAEASFAEATVDKTEPRDAAFHPEADAPWPGTADEASFLADQRGQGIAPPDAATGLASEPTDLSPLPSLDELVQRIPAEARAALDDLFRAKFTGVRRVSKKMLKT